MSEGVERRIGLPGAVFTLVGYVIGASIFISMRLLAEERQAGTLPLLYSSPVKDRDIVLGKYLAGLAFLAVFLVCTVHMPLLIMVNGKVSAGHIFAGYLGLLLLGSACMAVGTFGSALANNQIVAAIIAFALLGKAADSLLIAATGPLVRWQDTSRRAL